VNEEDVPRVTLGQQVLLRTDAFPGQPLAASVSDITPMGDVAAKTFRVKMGLPDDTPLRPGMSVEANIITRQQDNALLVPAEAVQGDVVFAIDGDRLKRRQVRIGIRGTRAVQVLSGLNEGDRVAAPVMPQMQDGLRVRVTEAAP
jgi:RND family efflux transporter MFP subunit